MVRKNDYTAEIDKFIGNKIVSLRLARGLSRKQLSEAVGITGQQLSKYEKGKNRVSIGRLILLSKALGEKVSYFYEGLELEVTYQMPIDHAQMRKEIIRNFMRFNNLEHQNAINQLLRVLLKDTIVEKKCKGDILMEQKVDEIKDSLVFILSKLESIGKQVRKQEEEIENYVKKNHIIDFNELVTAHLNSTKTSIELLRQEIEELHQLITLFVKNIEDGMEKGKPEELINLINK